MQNEKCGSERLAPRSPLPAPRSLRRAITLTEVLISMGILTLGLLGVAALFPVGGFYMQQADIADRGSAIAQSVMNDIVAKGMLNSRGWYVMTPAPAAPAVGATNYNFPTVDGKYTPFKPTAPVSATFTRPFAEALSEGLKLSSNPVTISRQFGNAFVIDPMYAAAAARPSTSNPNNQVAYPFPASTYMYPVWGSYYGSAQWDPWKVPSRKSSERTWPIRRVTFQSPTGWPLDATMAEHYCRGNDDLATDLPERDDRPARQNWDIANVGGTPTPLARQWAGDYSWIVSVVPTTNAARDGMARNPEGFAYDVSVVVYHKRALPAAPAQTGNELQEVASSERAVNAKIISTGLNGGELLLTDLMDIYDSALKPISPFGQLKKSQWIMLCGPHPNSTANDPRFVMNWYQVLSIESDVGTAIDNFDPDTQRVVAVRGLQWPWLPSSDLDYNNDLSNNLCVAICRGAVAVHTKTLRLESPRSPVMSLITPGSGPRPPYTVY